MAMAHHAAGARQQRATRGLDPSGCHGSRVAVDSRQPSPDGISHARSTSDRGLCVSWPDHPPDHPDDPTGPSRSDQIDEASNVSRPDPTGSDQSDVEHQATDLAVWGFESRPAPAQLPITRWPVAVARRDSAYSGACRQARRRDYCGRCQAASEALPSGSACSASKPRPGRGRTLLLTASWSHTAHRPPRWAARRSGVEAEEVRRDRRAPSPAERPSSPTAGQ
jgi:hypothetical protein